MGSKTFSGRANLVIALALLPLTCLAGQQSEPAQTEACGAAYRDSSGKAQGFLLPQLSKSLALQEEFSLPANAPANVVGIQCGRQSIVPLLTDLKITAAGYPFTILSGERIGTLTVVDGHLQFNMTVGEMTEVEMEQIGQVLDEGHRFLLNLESSDPLPASSEPAP